MKKVLIPNDDGSTAGADADTASILASIPPVAIQMTTILVTMLAVLAGLVQMQSFGDRTTKYVMYGPKHTLYLPSPTREPSKRAYETFCLAYTPVWISAFGYIVASGVYEQFTAWSYNYVCVGLALPLLLQPLLYTYSRWCPKQEQQRPFYQRYAFKANLWIAIFSFIGNYWYTHYFYSVLHAQYTMPAHRLNNVPIALYFATHFYFSTYHVLSNIMLRTITTRYSPTYLRHALFLGAILCFAYFTAFMETLTISSFPYYSFEDRDMAYTVGSAFYGIYFIVSFPMFFAFDIHIDDKSNTKSSMTKTTLTLWDTVTHSCGCGMVVLCLLDFCRLYLDIPLTVGY